MRVLIVRDAQWYRKQPLRSAQVTVWNVLNIPTRADDAPGHFREGDQYLVSCVYNLYRREWLLIWFGGLGDQPNSKLQIGLDGCNSGCGDSSDDEKREYVEESGVNNVQLKNPVSNDIHISRSLTALVLLIGYLFE